MRWSLFIYGFWYFQFVSHSSLPKEGESTKPSNRKQLPGSGSSEGLPWRLEGFFYSFVGEPEIRLFSLAIPGTALTKKWFLVPFHAFPVCWICEMFRILAGHPLTASNGVKHLLQRRVGKKVRTTHERLDLGIESEAVGHGYCWKRQNRNKAIRTNLEASFWDTGVPKSWGLILGHWQRGRHGWKTQKTKTLLGIWEKWQLCLFQWPLDVKFWGPCEARFPWHMPIGHLQELAEHMG